LALLRSSCDEADTRVAESARWNPGQAARRSFRSQVLAGRVEESSHADVLARRVNEAAGRPLRTQWFERDASARGIGLACSGPNVGLERRILGADAFPELLLRDAWDSAEDCRLVANLLAWQAPWLLALQTLSRSIRERLEPAACKRATLTAQLYPTYPEIVDPVAIRTARVEARLRAASGDAHGPEDQSGAAFFVTGN
jgi:hypothetical protein